MTTAATTAALQLAPRLRGDVIVPGHPGYDAARAIDNRSHQSRPAAVVRCADSADVAATVRFAAAEGLPLAIRAGGHSAAGFSSVQAGVVADLRGINHVRVDAERRLVAIGGGALAGQVDRATHPFGLATTTATVSTVGVAGFALGGGISYLTRKHGLAVDNLAGADVVLADGSLARAGEGGDEDLLWALRGGGGNVGVVTELRMRLHPVSVVTGGPMLFPLERAERLVRLYRDWMPQQADDIYAFLALLTIPPDEAFPEELRLRPVCALIWCNTAPEDQSNAALATFRRRRRRRGQIRPPHRAAIRGPARCRRSPVRAVRPIQPHTAMPEPPVPPRRHRRPSRQQRHGMAVARRGVRPDVRGHRPRARLRRRPAGLVRRLPGRPAALRDARLLRQLPDG